MRRLLTTAALAYCSMALAEDKVTYDDHVLPIFEQACTNCHNPDKKKGGLDLSSYTGTLAGGSGGMAVTAGEGADSRLFLTSSHSMEPFMPPEGEKLNSKQLKTIRSWIDGGLLETANSRVKKAPQNKIQFSSAATGKPSGPPPMPANLSTEPITIPQRSTTLDAMESSPWAPLIALSGHGQVLLYHSDKLQLVGVLPFPKSGQATALAFHPSGKFLTAAGGTPGKNGITATWDVTTGKLLKTVAKEYDSILSTSVRADMQAIATGSPSKRLKTWNTADGSNEHSIKKHTDWVTAVSYSPDGILLASGDRNGGLWVWEAHSGMQLHNLRGHQGQIVSLKWSADSNYLASASEDGSLRFWNMNSGKQLKKIDAHKGGVLSMDWAKDGQILSAGRDQKIKHWNPNYSLKKEIHITQSLITKVRFSHDAKRIVSANYDGVVQVWNCSDYQLAGTLDSIPKKLSTRLQLAESQFTAADKHYQATLVKFQAEEQKQSKLAENKTQTLAKIQQQSQQLKHDKQKLEKLNKQLTDNSNKIKQLDQLRKQEEKKLRDQNKRLAEADKQKKLDEHNLRQAQRNKQAADNEVTKHQKALQAWEEKLKKSPDDQHIVGREKQCREQLSTAKVTQTKADSAHTAQASKVKSSQTAWQQQKTAAQQHAKQVQQHNESWHQLHQQKNQFLQQRKQIETTTRQTQSSIAQLKKSVPSLDKQLNEHKKVLATSAKSRDQAQSQRTAISEEVSRLSAELKSVGLRPQIRN